MFCTQCGKQAVEGAVYCAFCGARMHAADQGPDTAIDEQKTGNDGSSGDRGEWARRWSERSPLRSTAAIGITLVLVVGGGWALRASLGGANTGRSMRGAQQAEGSQGDASVVVRVSVATTGMEGNGESYGRAHCMSKTCQFVAFDSDATNLVAGDTNGFTDVFVRDQASGRTERVSVSSAGAEANQWSGCPAISADGTVVAFESNATNLVSGDTNGAGDVFVHDRRTGETVRASVSTTGAQAHGVSSVDDISDDGLFVAFTSDAADLVPGDTDSRMDVFVHDRASGCVRGGGTGERWGHLRVCERRRPVRCFPVFSVGHRAQGRERVRGRVRASPADPTDGAGERVQYRWRGEWRLRLGVHQRGWSIRGLLLGGE
jgi:hypothetical protein